MNLGPDVRSYYRSILGSASESARSVARKGAQRRRALFFERNGRVTCDPALQPGEAGSSLGHTAQHSVRIRHPVSNSLPLSVV